MVKNLASRIKILRTPSSWMFWAAGLFMAVAYCWHLGSLPSGFSPAEAGNIANSSSLQTLFSHPFAAPHNFLQYLLIKLNHDSVFNLRLVSVIWALFIITGFYKICKCWFGTLVAWLAALMLASTPLVILAARSASYDIMYLAPALVAGSYFWLSRSEPRSKLAMAVFFATAALALYTPGSIWLLLIGLVSVRGSLPKILAGYGRLVWLGWLAFGALLAPLVAALVNSPSLISEWLLLPDSWQPLPLLKDVGWAGLGLVWQSAHHNDLQLGRLAILNYAQLVLLVLGIFALYRRASLKALGLAVIALVGVIGAGLSGAYGVELFGLAAVSVAIAAGLRYLHIEWQSVFPKNPLARNFALVLICVVVGFNVAYGIHYALSAWPHNVVTRQTYMLK